MLTFCSFGIVAQIDDFVLNEIHSKSRKKGDIYVFLEGCELTWDPTLKSPIQKLHCEKN
jgi:hypothetical protein